jgi:hypothetical protein
MKQLFSLACVLGLFVTTVGCDKGASNSATNDGDGGINIQWPGGSVQVDPKTGDTRVKTKSVDVDAGLDRGARVRTPNADVDANAKGVDVNAPGAKVDINR